MSITGLVKKVLVMATSTTLIQVDCQSVTGELKRIWRSIGFDEINWSYTERGKDLLKTLKGMKNTTIRNIYVNEKNLFIMNR